MRLPFLDPRKDKVAAIATDLITRFGLRAHYEASYLAKLSVQMHSRRDRVLYELVAREIDASFLEAQRLLGLRQDALDTARSGVPQRQGPEGDGDRARDGTDLTKLDRLVLRVRSQAADAPTSLVADLNLFDIDSAPRRRFGSR